MKFLVVLLSVVMTSQCLGDMNEDWTQFKMKFGKYYDRSSEEEYRMSIFMENKRIIDDHNIKYELGTVSFRMGINEYTDMTYEEFIKKFTGFRSTKEDGMTTSGLSFISPTNVTIPDSIDWRTKGAVTPVKNQKHCGSCWSFSSTGAIEGQHFLKTGELVSLSEQNLMDCSTEYGNTGCGGGWMHQAFQYVKNNGGIDTEESYPYEGRNGPCRYNPKNSGATVTGYVMANDGDEKKLQEAVGTIGPVSIGIAVSKSFYFYESGVFEDNNCPEELKHGVLAVGYGTDGNGKDYWIVKNSWGANWGEEGYILMTRNKNNMCGVGKETVYPLV